MGRWCWTLRFRRSRSTPEFRIQYSFYRSANREKTMNFVQRALVSCVAFLAITTSLVLGQVATGTAPFNSFGGGPFDAVNLGNLNVHFSIPVFHKAGRAGYNFTYDLSYDGAVWSPVVSGNTTTWKAAANWGWRGQTEVTTGYITYTTTQSQ